MTRKELVGLLKEMIQVCDHFDLNMPIEFADEKYDELREELELPIVISDVLMFIEDEYTDRDYRRLATRLIDAIYKLETGQEKVVAIPCLVRNPVCLPEGRA